MKWTEITDREFALMKHGQKRLQLFSLDDAGNLVRQPTPDWATDADRDVCMLIRDEITPEPARKFGPLPKRNLTEREQRYKNLMACPEIGSRQALVIGTDT